MAPAIRPTSPEISDLIAFLPPKPQHLQDEF
jgi:hypothetical protein